MNVLWPTPCAMFIPKRVSLTPGTREPRAEVTSARLPSKQEANYGMVRSNLGSKLGSVGALVQRLFWVQRPGAKAAVSGGTSQICWARISKSQGVVAQFRGVGG